MIRVVIESPYKGPGMWANVGRNLAYLRAAMADCFARGEAPYASHGLYTQDGVLDDKVPAERALGIEGGFAWGEVAQKRVVYTDLGITGGMEKGIRAAGRLGQTVEYRQLPDWYPSQYWKKRLARAWLDWRDATWTLIIVIWEGVVREPGERLKSPMIRRASSGKTRDADARDPR